MNSKACGKAAAIVPRSPHRKGRKKEQSAVFYDCSACEERFYSSASLHKHQQLVHRQQRTGRETRCPAEPPKGQFFDPADPQDVNFFRSIHQKIADNLLHHVDGKLPASSCPKKSSLVADTPVCPREESHRPDFSFYNFADDNATSAAVTSNESTAPLTTCDLKVDGSETPVLCENSKNSSLNYVCSVCGERFSCRSAFSGHAENNHPNVSYSYFLVHQTENDVPSQLGWRYNSPQGFLTRCEVVSYATYPATGLKCTKCGDCFQSTDLLHHHVLECASSSSPRSSQPAIRAEDESSAPRTRSGKRRSLQSSSQAANSPTNKRKKLPLTNHHHVRENDAHDSNNNEDEPKIDTNSLNCETCDQKFSLIDSLTSHVTSCRKENSSPGSAEAVRIKESHNFRGEQLKSSDAAVSLPAVASNRKKRGTGSKSDPPLSGSISGVTSDEQEGDAEGQEAREEGHVCQDCGKRFAYAANFKKHTDNKCCSAAKKPGVTAIVCKKSGNDVSAETSRGSELTGGEETEVDELEGDREDEKVSESLAAASIRKTDVWQVKQEHPLYAFKGSPAQHHTCPYCQRGFTYLANYTKHVKQICPIRQQIDAKKRLILDGCDVSAVNSENSALNSNDSQQNHKSKGKFCTHACNVCHKIYFSLVELMKHRLSHKLFNESPNARSKHVNDDKTLSDGSLPAASVPFDEAADEFMPQPSAGMPDGSPSDKEPASQSSPSSRDKETHNSADTTLGVKIGAGGRTRELRRTIRNKQ